MKKLLAIVAALLIAVLTQSDLRAADRLYSYCDPTKSRLCLGLVALYEFEEQSDSIRYNETGDVPLRNASTNVPQSGTKVTGSYSAYFSNGNFLYLTNTVGFSGEFTVGMWIRPASLPSADTKRSVIFSMRDSNSVMGYPILMLYRSGANTYPRFEVRQPSTGTISYVQDDTAVSIDTWYYLTFGQYPDPTTAAEPFRYTMWMSLCTGGSCGARVTQTVQYPGQPDFGAFLLGSHSATSPYEQKAFYLDQFAIWNWTHTLSVDTANVYNSGSGRSFPFAQ